MATFAQIADNLKKIDFDVILNRVLSSINLEKWAVEQIQKRLYNQGITGSLIKLKTDKGQPYYTHDYIKVKKRKGEKTTNVTLYLDGGFYQRLNVKLEKEGFSINTDFEYLTVHFKNIYSSEDEGYSDILSLTDKEIENMLDTKVIPQLIKRFSESF